MSAWLIASLLLADAESTRFKLVDFDGGEPRGIAISHESRGSAAGPPTPLSALPTAGPSLPSRGSKFVWLVMRNTPAPGLLHRFSYPHRSSADLIAPLPADADPADVKFLEKERADTIRREAEFSPTNLYYEYGSPDAVEPSHIADRNGYSLPGRSGSALIDSTRAIVALLSRAYEGTTYSCRLTPSKSGRSAQSPPASGPSRTDRLPLRHRQD